MAALSVSTDQSAAAEALAFADKFACDGLQVVEIKIPPYLDEWQWYAPKQRKKPSDPSDTSFLMQIRLETVKAKPEDRIDRRFVSTSFTERQDRSDEPSNVSGQFISTISDERPMLMDLLFLMLCDEEWKDFLHLDFDDFSLTVRVEEMAKKGGGTAVRYIMLPNDHLLRLEISMRAVSKARYQPR